MCKAPCGGFWYFDATATIQRSSCDTYHSGQRSGIIIMLSLITQGSGVSPQGHMIGNEALDLRVSRYNSTLFSVPGTRCSDGVPVSPCRDPT